MRKFPLFLAGLLGSAYLFGQEATTQIDLLPAAPQVPATAVEQFLDYEVFQLDHTPLYDLWRTGGERIEFDLVPHTGTTVSLELYRYDLRAPNYVLRSGSRAGRGAKLHRRLPSAQYKGLTNSQDQQTAIVTIDSSYLLAYWQTEGEEFFLEPLWRFWPEAERDLYVRYRATGVVDSLGTCSAVNRFDGDHDHRHGHHHDHTAGASGRSNMGDCLEVDLAIAADFELFQDFGSVSATENWMLNGLALVQTNYDSQPGDEEFDDELRYLVTSTYIANNNANDPWTNSNSANDLLDDFTDWGNDGNFSNPHDVATLWTGRNFDGGTIGLAWLDAVCSSVRYNVCENFSSNTQAMRVLWAHELGHNFGSNHDSGGGFIMSPSVNTSTTWSASSRNQINNYYQNINCLTNCPQFPPVANFSASANNICPGNQVAFNDASSGVVDNYQWSFPGGTPSSSTEPSPIVTYENAGNYVASLTVSNELGSNSSSTNISVAPGQTDLRVVQNFEADNFGTLTPQNPDGSFGWELGNVSGNGGQIVAYMNNYEYNADGQVDRLVLPTQDMTSSSSLRLEFEYAYVRYNANFRDQLRVTVTTQDGTDEVFFGDETGGGNFATGPDNLSFFVANSPSDWCFTGPQCISLDLSAYDGLPEVGVAIENINGYGNTMFVDNIVLSAICTPPQLPVEWLSFEARPRENAARLDWAVNQDELHAGFVVERASTSQAANWQNLGFVPARGGAASEVAYAFDDYEVQAGQTYYYRLRQQDVDGRESFSLIRTVTFGELATEASIWPNPADNELSLLTSGEGGQYELIDARGRTIGAAPLSGRRTRIDLEGVPPGLYALRVIYPGGRLESLKLVRR